MLKVQKLKSKIWTAKFRFFFVFFLSSLIAYSFDLLITEYFKKEEPSYDLFSDTIFNFSQLYQTLITAGPRELKQSYTALIEIDRENDDVYKSKTTVGPCGNMGEREAMKRLLERIDIEKPAVIVIDKYYLPDSCPPPDGQGTIEPGTKNLVRTIQEISLHTPIVVGVLAELPEENADTNTFPILKPSLFPDSESKPLQGIVNINKDNRKLPIQWEISGKKDQYPTLSWVAIEAYYGMQHLNFNEDLPRLERLRQENINPYISFISELHLKEIQAGELLNQDSNLDLSNLRGKVVVIGVKDKYIDIHHSPIGEVPGYKLHANYIEAVLDQRYYEPCELASYILGFLIFVLIHYFVLVEETRWKQIAGVVGVFIISCGLIYMVVAIGGVYINPITLSSLALAIIFTHLIFPHSLTKHTDTKQNDGVSK